MNSLKEYMSQDWQLARKVSNRSFLTVPFEKYERIDVHNSQAGQDLFVLSCLDGKTNGLYVELGCWSPSLISNTFLLETVFGWNGMSVDTHPIQHQRDPISWKQRNTTLLVEDGTKIDFEKISELLKSKHFDYLQLDMDPADVTLRGLKNVPFDKVEFSVITYEHDYYTNQHNGMRDASRKIFRDNGYELLCQDVHWHGKNFEDWYYNPKYIVGDRVEAFRSAGKEWTSIIFNKSFRD